MLAVQCVAVIIVYFVLFFMFGIWALRIAGGKSRSLGYTIIIGFFAYYAVFQIFAIPMMFSLMPLSMLTKTWSIVALIVVVSCILSNKEYIETVIKGAKESCRKNKGAVFLIVSVTLCNLLIAGFIYASYYDATFYVGTVSYSVYYDTINTIDPLFGETLDMFDIKHCLATYHMNDAVFCQLFGIHPLVETKTIMVSVITVIGNIVYFQTAKRMLGGDCRKAAVMLLFILLINLCTYSSFTASSFFIFRTYEGKAVTGTITMSALLMVFLDLNQNDREFRNWFVMFMIAWGGIAVSSSAMFLIPVAIVGYGTGLGLVKKNWRCVIHAGICTLPAVIALGCYFLNRLGIFYVYAHPVG